MANLVPLSLCFLVLLFHGCCCFAQIELQQQNFWQNMQRQQQHNLRAKTDCRINRLTAQEPTLRFSYEAGETEYWETNNEQFQCAGVAAVRNTIQPRGLLLPHYNNAPQILYVVQGRGLQGTVFSGCAETYETTMRGSSREGGERQSFTDRHQKVRQFREGDVLALPAGVTLWFYNNGEDPIVTVALLDTGNLANQLDLNFRNFFLAGNEQRASGGRYNPERHQQKGHQHQQQQGDFNNIFRGFDEEILEEVFQVDRETIRNLQAQEDNRGRIVNADNFQVIVPEYDQEEEEISRRGGKPSNGLEETFCTMKLGENIANPIRADVYNPRGGRIRAINSQTLPILGYLKLNAEKGNLYSNALIAPHWNMNAHSVIYATRGNARIQVVGNQGRPVFDDEVQEGQMIIVPQNFAVLKKAGERGFEWIAFKTNDNVMTSPLAGRLSALRSMPIDVLINSYQISREDAQNLKYNREELTVLSPSRSSSSRSRPSRGMEIALKAMESVM